jgi:protein-L-isoaspartate O-methyltransferase
MNDEAIRQLEEGSAPYYIGTSTYSPEDNKLRIYPFARLDADVYERVKASGFKWAPKQELFVAPMWTPSREDLAIELCGDIEDEDKSLVDRAEAKAERLEDLSDRKQAEAIRAHDSVASIADNIPLGQPILVGHHSERHARKDAKKIENGMRKAVECWKSVEYWKDRAASVLRHAKYKESPAVRARRIKGIEADKRKMERERKLNEKSMSVWQKVAAIEDKDKQLVMALAVAGNSDYGRFYMPIKDGDRQDWNQPPNPDTALGNYYPSLYAPRTVDEVLEIALSPDTFPARVAYCNRWIDHYENRLAYERTMLGEAGGIATDRKPIETGGAVRVRLWSPGSGRGWAIIQKVNKVTVTILHKWNSDTRPFRHNVPFDEVREIMTAEEVEKARAAGQIVESACGCGFFLNDTPPPTPKLTAEKTEEEKDREKSMRAMEETLSAGVQVVTAPQLFPTPPELAARMVQEAGIEAGDSVLEPSAGTGNLLNPLPTVRPGGQVVAVEINASLVPKLEAYADVVICGDFLEQNGNLGNFDRIVMNPPFKNGADIKHIQHAMQFLKPGGRLVAVCANGPRQRETLKPLAEQSGGFWEDLPVGTFKEQGTNINTALLVIVTEAD